jgi:hypothetical protein
MILAVVILAALIPSSALADMGVGIIVGEPTGLSLKWWDEGTAVDAAIGWSIGDDSFYGHCDYVWHRRFESMDFGTRAPFYYGIGGRFILRDNEDSKMGLRVPIGLDYMFDSGRFDIFVEIVPIFDVMPETDFGVGGGIGARYYF